jgi:pyrimidine-nucleoside phosphorylase
MVSGRGLGHTGGTLDKLEAIPGFRVDLDTTAFRRILREVGTCMIGQTARLAPADKRIYALRDVTATVECIPLIVASILSKKLAEGIDALVLDVKVGQGAFMKDLPSARELATALARVGAASGKSVVALLTDMDAPLGLTIGNALETREALEVLHGRGPSDVIECTLALGAEMLQLGGAATSAEEARWKLGAAIRSGAALRVAEKLIEAQGGDVRVAARPELLPRAPVQVEVLAADEGYLHAIQAFELGLVSVALGAGRTRADQAVDPVVGLELHAQRGDHVVRGQRLATLHVRTEDQALGSLERVRQAFRLRSEPPALGPLVIERIAVHPSASTAV